MKIKNLRIYGLGESCIRSGYPMQTREPADLDDIGSGNDDIIRAYKLAKNEPGTGHNNFLKGIVVQFDLLYPQYFAPQFQRYHWFEIISSQSKMHRLTQIANIKSHCNRFVFHDIARTIDGLIEIYNDQMAIYPVQLEQGDHTYNCIDRKELYHYIISNLPMGYELWAGISTNYLQLKTIYKQRRWHKLDDWREFCEFIEGLPMSDLITK